MSVALETQCSFLSLGSPIALMSHVKGLIMSGLNRLPRKTDNGAGVSLVVSPAKGPCLLLRTGSHPLQARSLSGRMNQNSLSLPQD